ncbi:unnamed protein product [Nesidiocoris tenuis]|uniref:Uncharacterized protein n=1 Tax=Nesidiocoris tenuis TaxID=355587 RepID=A0A6H5FXL0_9HEMI|nr:unnamed protein product [Nesidiocoris tenuis]
MRRARRTGMVDLAETGKRRGKGCRRALGLVNGSVACDLDPDSLVTRPGRDSEGEGVPQGRGQGELKHRWSKCLPLLPPEPITSSPNLISNGLSQEREYRGICRPLAHAQCKFWQDTPQQRDQRKHLKNLPLRMRKPLTYAYTQRSCPI